MKIAFFDAKEYDVKSFDKANADAENEIRYFYDRLNSKNADLAKGFDAVCTFVNDRLFADTLEKLAQNNIKLILLRCAGFNNVDLEAAERLGITVLNVPEYSPYGVAEHTLALILALNRKIHKAYNRTKEYNFSLRGLLGFEMEGKTVGVIGLGKIGRSTADLLCAFHCKVIAYDLYPNMEYAKSKCIEIVPLDEIWRNSDIITLHCPLSKESKHIINEDSISKMKPGVMLINTSRGGLIDTKALIAGLKHKIIANVGLDVYEEEERYFFEDFTDSILEDDTLLEMLSLPNVLVTSHQAFFTREALEKIAQITLKNAYDYSAGKDLLNKVKIKK